jgi:CheY-like chemotaxis protein
MINPSLPLPVAVLADDHADTREMYGGYLRAHGFHVVEASDGFEAVTLVKRLRPAVLVLDVIMPRMDGITALRRIRQVKELHDMPILVLTSYDVHEEEARAAGATAVCVKPCRPDSLLEQLRHLVEPPRSRWRLCRQLP